MIYIRFTPETKIGDVTLTVLHEVCHAVLGGTTKEQIFAEHKVIYSVEYSYLVALGWLGVEFSHGHLSFTSQLKSKAIKHDKDGLYRIPITEILNKWICGWEKW